MADEKYERVTQEVKEPKGNDGPQPELSRQRERKAKPVTVRVIERRGEALLVEWPIKDDYKRAIIPATVYDAQTKAVGDVDLEAGIPYGLPWEELIVLHGTTLGAARQLRRHGIWTRADLVAHPQMAQQSLSEAYALDLRDLLDRAKEAE